MKKSFILFATLMVASAFLFAAGQTESHSKSTPATKSAETVTVNDIHGTVQVKKNPKTVVALDNRTFETLYDLGVKPVAVPKNVMPPQSPFALDSSIQNIGNHREPNLEIIAAVNPDLVIVGQRFARFYDQIKELVPHADIIDLTWDVSAKAEKPGENLINGLIYSTQVMGEIFSKEAEAAKKVEAFKKAISDVKAAYDPSQSVMSIIVTGGKVRFSAPKTGRVWGPLYEVFDFTPALEIKDGSADHKGDNISVEAIAETNPYWILVLDRDAATSSQKGASAKDTLENSQVLKNLDAIKNGRVIYAPNDTYTNESIETYIELFGDMAKAFSK